MLLLLVLFQFAGVILATWTLAGPLAQWRRNVAEARAERAGLPLTQDAFQERYPPAPAEADLAGELSAAAGAMDIRQDAWQAYDRDYRDPDEPGVPQGAALAVLRGAAASQPEVVATLEAMDDRLVPGARANWPRPHHDGPNGDLLLGRTLPHLSDQRALTNFQYARMLAAGGDGEWETGFKVLRQELARTEAMAESEMLAEYLAAAGMEAKALRGAERLATSLPPQAIGSAVEERALRELVSLLMQDQHGANLRRGLEGEVVQTLDAMDGSIDPERLVRALDQPAERAGMKALSADLAHWTARPIIDNDAAIYLDFLRATIVALDAPTFVEFEQRAPSDDVVRELAESPMPHPFAAMLIPTTSRSAEAAYRNATHRRLIAAALAVRLYQADNDGALPPDLEALVPTYLPSVPRDAMAADSAVRYDPERRRLWTAGENRQDDGGTASFELLKDNPTLGSRALREASDHVIPLN